MNLNKIRESEAPFKKINKGHDLIKSKMTKYQKKIKEEQEKELKSSSEDG